VNVGVIDGVRVKVGVTVLVGVAVRVYVFVTVAVGVGRLLVKVTRLFVSAIRLSSALECAVIVFVCAVSLYMTICP
jgi:hypothetical protein